MADDLGIRMTDEQVEEARSKRQAGWRGAQKEIAKEIAALKEAKVAKVRARWTATQGHESYNGGDSNIIFKDGVVRELDLKTFAHIRSTFPQCLVRVPDETELTVDEEAVIY